MGVRVREQDGSWYVFVNHQGKRRALKCASKRAAEIIRDQVDAKLKLGQVEVLDHAPAKVAPTKFPSLRDAVENWIAARERSGDLRGGTPSAYRSRLAGWAYPHALADGRLLGDLPVDQVTREMLGGLVLKIKGAGKSRTLIGHVRFPISGFYQEQVELGVLSVNPAANLTHFVGKKKPAKAIQPFTQEEIKKLMDAARALQPRWSAFIATGILAGLRCGEIAGLQKGDVDFKRGAIHVQRSYSEKSGKLEPPKNGKTRHVEACKDLLDALKAQLEMVALDGQVKGWSAETRQLVFPRTTGRVLPLRNFYDQVWGPLLKAAGIPHHGFHATRHTFATLLLEAGADIRWVSQQLGHATVGQTLDVYSHLVHDAHKANVTKLQGIIG